MTSSAHPSPPLLQRRARFGYSARFPWAVPSRSEAPELQACAKQPRLSNNHYSNFHEAIFQVLHGVVGGTLILGGDGRSATAHAST